MRPFSARISLLMMLVAAILPISGMAAFAAGSLLGEEAIAVTPPDSAQAARLLNLEPPLRIIREECAVPGWAVSAASAPVGYIASTWEIARSAGYSGRPIDVLPRPEELHDFETPCGANLPSHATKSRTA